METEIKNYFKLKEKYEKGIFKKKCKNLILLNSVYTTEEKKFRINLIENKCVNCGKEGGTIFSNNNRVLRAVCGNKKITM